MVIRKFIGLEWVDPGAQHSIVTEKGRLMNKQEGFDWDYIPYLTFCEECGEDMTRNGGNLCLVCNMEFCFECIDNHDCEANEKTT
jgi:hypothetical protein